MLVVLTNLISVKVTFRIKNLLQPGKELFFKACRVILPGGKKYMLQTGKYQKVNLFRFLRIQS
jgi:hypothetical protein